MTFMCSCQDIWPQASSKQEFSISQYYPIFAVKRKHSLYADSFSTPLNLPHLISFRIDKSISVWCMCCLKIGIVTTSITCSILLTIVSAFSFSLLQSNLCITTTGGTKFLRSLQTGGRYKADPCITAKTVNSNILVAV